MVSLSNCRVFNGMKTLDGPYDVTIEGNTIASVSRHAPSSIQGADVIDLNGLTLMPGS